MKTEIEIPKGQKSIIKKALEVYKTALSPMENQNDAHKVFDITTLNSLLNSKVYVHLSEDEVTNFTMKNGVDLPEYVGVKTKITKENYPKDSEVQKMVIHYNENNDSVVFRKYNGKGELIFFSYHHGTMDDIDFKYSKEECNFLT